MKWPQSFALGASNEVTFNTPISARVVLETEDRISKMGKPRTAVDKTDLKNDQNRKTQYTTPPSPLHLNAENLKDYFLPFLNF